MNHMYYLAIIYGAISILLICRFAYLTFKMKIMTNKDND